MLYFKYFFLDVGYHLLLKFEGNDYKNKIIEKILEHMPESKVKEETGCNISVLLPSDKKTEYPNLLGYIESNYQKYGIISFSLKNTTMEDVFLR